MKVLSFIMGLTVFTTIIAGISSCKNSTLTPLSAAPVISFKNDVQPLITSYCTESGCHGTDGSRRLKLLNYADVMTEVSAGKPHSSNLYQTIAANTINTMPKPPNARMTDTEIKTIYLWILEGANNN